MTVLLSAAFVAAALVHLYACLKKHDSLRRITKPVLMPLLLGCYLAAAEAPSALIAAALLCGTAGDAFLLYSDPVRFAAGTGFFAVGHICYVHAMLLRAGDAIPQSAVLPCCAAYALFAALCGLCFRPRLPKKLIAGCIVYMFLLAAMSCASLLLALSGAAGAWFAFAGSLLFLLSDAILTYTTFCSAGGEKRFTVMLTYILAQALLTVGLIGGI